MPSKLGKLEAIHAGLQEDPLSLAPHKAHRAQPTAPITLTRLDPTTEADPSIVRADLDATTDVDPMPRLRKFEPEEPKAAEPPKPPTLLDKLQARGALTRDYAVVIVRMDRDQGTAGEKFGQRCLAGDPPWAAEDDFSAMAAHRGDLHRRRVLRHDDYRRNAAQLRRQCERRTVVSRRVGGYTTRGQRLGQGEHRVRCTAQLECPAALQVLALEDQARTELGIECFISQERRATDVRADASRSCADGGEIRYVFAGGQFGAHALFQSIGDGEAIAATNKRSR